MGKKKLEAQPPQPPLPATAPQESRVRPQTIIDSCHVEVKGVPCNEHTRAAIEALAKAAQANAEAISACAKAMQGGAINLEAGIKVGG